ncbi:MAG: hypothetical protein ACJAZO_000723 [Myxococcota bacterium]
MAKLEVVHRNRFLLMPDATVVEIGGGAWEIRIPIASPIHASTKRSATPEGWDEAIFSIDGAETQPGMGSGSDSINVVVTALIF